jgi:hypothetical protein
LKFQNFKFQMDGEGNCKGKERRGKDNCRSLNCDARHRFAMEEEATRVSARDDRLGLGARDRSLETGVKAKA